jgi:hypothetical protein
MTENNKAKVQKKKKKNPYNPFCVGAIHGHETCPGVWLIEPVTRH